MAIASESISMLWRRSSKELMVRSAHRVDIFDAATKKCVWHDGFWANRDDISAGLGADPGLDSVQLLLRAWEHFGPELCNRIIGTLAWIIWDGPAQTIHIVRDRVGTNEIFYRAVEGQVVVAPAIESILEGLDQTPRINRDSVFCHLHLRLPFPGETFYDGIHAIEPAQHIEIRANKINKNEYWKPTARPVLTLKQDEAVATYSELLENVVSEYSSHEKTAVTVSSGMDSTSIAAVLANSHHPGGVLAQVWTCPELPDADESAAARSVCQFLGLPHTEIRSDLLWTLSAPDAPATSAGTPFSGYCYRELWSSSFRSAAQHDCKFMFTGMPADNLFGGNISSYADLLLTGKWLKLAAQVQAELRLPNSSPRTILRQRLQAPMMKAFIPPSRSILPIPWLRPTFASFSRLNRLEVPDDPWLLPGRKQRHAYLNRRLLAMFVPLANRWAAQYDIELRHPFLDHRMIEFAARLPAIHTFQGGTDKVIMRRAMHKRLPSAILERREKTYPNAIYLRGIVDREKDKVRNLLSNMRSAEFGWVDEQCVRSKYERGRWLDHLWYTLTLEDWLRRFH